jgi:prolyl-tRNA synthetase
MSEQLGITVKKEENFSEWFSEVCLKAGLIDQRYNVQGFIVHRPWAMRIIKEIFKMLEKELESTGHEPVLFPTVIPEENFEKEKEHVEGFKPEVFWITEAGDNKLERRLALRPTSETAFYQMYSLWIRSWRDLPLKLYQSVNVFRYESDTRPFLRGREFLWIEAHDAFATHEEALKQVREDMEITKKVIWEKLGIPFLFLRRPEWDKFAGAVDTYAADTIMPDGKVNQISSTHDLGRRFARAFDIKFVDREGKKQYVWQTCHGPGIWRIMAALIAIHGDNKGLVLPFEVAPIQIIIIPIFFSDEDKQKVMKKCEKIDKLLKEADIRSKIDTREETPGWKFNDWELKGVPFRIEIGPREATGDFVSVCRRDTGERKTIKDDKLIVEIKKMSENLLENLKKRSQKLFENSVKSVATKEFLIDLLNKGGIAKISFCGREECAMDLKEKTNGGKVRGVVLDQKETPNEKCIWCGKKAEQVVYVAKAY